MSWNTGKSVLSLLQTALVVGTGLAAEDERHRPRQAPRPPPAGEATPGREDGLFAEAGHLAREDLVREVLQRNPTVEAARQAWLAAIEAAPQARSLEDPLTSYSVAPESLGAGEVRPGHVVRIGQRFPFPGTLRLRGTMADARAEVAHENYETVRLDLALATSDLFDDYYVLFRATEINEEHIDLLGQFKRVATARYAAGIAAQQDPIQAESELAHLLHRRVVLEARRGILAAGINALLHRPPGAPLPPPPGELPIPGMPAAGPADLQEEALARRPAARAARAEIRRRRDAVDLEVREGYPSFEASTSYNTLWSTPQHRWAVGIAVAVPLWRQRIRAAVAEAQALLAQAESDHARIEDAIRSEVQVAWERLREAEHVLRLYRDRLLPPARDQIQAALAGFETGRNSFLAVIEAERNERSVSLGYEEALADHDRARAALDRALGRMPIPERREGKAP